MMRLLVRVQTKANLESIKSFCEIVYVSAFLNVIGVEIEKRNLDLLKKDPNVISFRESERGKYQPNVANC